MGEEVLSSIGEWNRRGIDFVLTTVVGVRGSTYRGLGARQLVARDGTTVGTVSGGCLDNELIAIAHEMDSNSPSRLVSFDLTADDEAVWGWGIGCNGVTELLVEGSISAGALVAEIEQTPPALLHILSGDRLGTHVSIAEGDPDWGDELVEARRDGRHRRLHRDGNDYLLELLSASPRLVVSGAGHDAVPLVRLGKELGYEVTVVDDRRAFLTRERFPEADRLVQCAPAELADRIEVDDRSAFVIMSHNYLRDVEFLGSLLGKGAAYIGCLGPGERLERMLKDLSARGQVPEPTEPIYGPAGLDLGADGPTEIAWSILSEITAVRRHRRGGSLVERKGPAGWRPLPWTSMKITQEFNVGRPRQAVWEQFQDVSAVAQCLPGATLTEDKGNNVYGGNLTVKLGPIAATFEGEATVDADPDNHTAVIDGKGVDKRGGSRGQVKVTYSLAEAGSETNVKIDADVTLAGPAAQFGRTGLINEMSKRLITDFVSCLEAKMAAPTTAAAAEVEAGNVKPIRLFFASLLAWIRGLIRKPS